MKISTLFFDLDDTLYPSGNGLWEAIRNRMNRYMVEQLKIPEEEVAHLRKKYFETYGTTLRGLQIHYGIDPIDFLAYVHDLPLKNYLKPDPSLQQLLAGLAHPKWIFTNADRRHARRVLAELDLESCFQGIIDIQAVDFICKPQVEAYQKALKLAGEDKPSRCVFFDDSARNLAPARELGFFTVLVGTTEPNPAACLSIRDLHQLSEVFPELWTK